MSIEEILADVKAEGTDPFKEYDKEATPSESLPEKKEEEKPTSGETAKEPADNTEDEDTPFHKRWKVREDKLKSELESKYQNEFETYKQQIEQKISEVKPKETSTVAEWFKELYGDNQVAWEKYEEHEKTKEDEIERRVIERQEQSRKQAEDDVKHWNKWVDDEVVKLQGEGLKFDRNELIKVMLDYRPTDMENNFDFKAGYKILEALKAKEVDPAHSQARKQIADTTTKSSGDGKKTKDFLTTADLRGKSWNSL